MKHYLKSTNPTLGTLLVVIDESGEPAFVPIDEGNRDYRDFLELEIDVDDLEEAPLA